VGVALAVFSVALGVGIIALGRMANAADIPNAGPGYILADALIGLGVVLVSAVLVRTVVLPALALKETYVLVLSFSVGVSVVLMPLIMLGLQRANLIAAAMSWLVGVVAVCSVMLAGYAALDVVSAGSTEAAKARARTREMQQFLDDQTGSKTALEANQASTP
jgi:hypothetical protein